MTGTEHPHDPTPDDQLPPGAVSFPFVATQARGGPYDTAAYTAGAELGDLIASLRLAKAMRMTPEPRVIRSQNELQAQLVAMAYGFTCDRADWPPATPVTPEQAEDWVFVAFLPAVDDVDVLLLEEE